MKNKEHIMESLGIAKGQHLNPLSLGAELQ